MKVTINFSKRWLYTFIAIGILAIIGVGVYAVNTNEGWHPASQIDFSSGISGNLVVDGNIQTTPNRALPYIVLDSISSGDNWNSQGAYISIGESGGLGSASMHMTYRGDGYGFIGSGAVVNGVPGYSYLRFDYNSKEIYTDSSITASSFLYSSDERLKTNIQPLQDSLSNILQLEGISFNWKENGQANIGLIAQDVEKVFPELVSTDSEGMKSVEYGNLVAVFVEAIKEQQKQIDVLRKEVEELKREIS